MEMEALIIAAKKLTIQEGILYLCFRRKNPGFISRTKSWGGKRKIRIRIKDINGINRPSRKVKLTRRRICHSVCKIKRQTNKRQGDDGVGDV